MSYRNYWATCVLTLCFASPGFGGAPPDPATILVRELIQKQSGGDLVRGNFERRNDRFRNTSPDYRVVVDRIETVLLNPEELGFRDLEPGNVPAVRLAAAAAHPDFYWWGTCFWTFPNAPLDVPPVNWVGAEFPRNPLPLTIQPGKSLVLQTLIRNDILGPLNPRPQDVGELVIGWRFVAKTIPATCGNGMPDPTEECDDGNTDNADACRNDCRLPLCGDGIVDLPDLETCDPPGSPAGASGNRCRADCTSCGDGRINGAVDPGSDGVPGTRDDLAEELCDDGNDVDDDECRNNCRPPGTGPGNVINPSIGGPTSVVVADVNGDGAVDVVSAAFFDGKIVWHQNTNGDGSAWTDHAITTSAARPRSIHVADLDGDGDADVLSASSADQRIAWYENVGGTGLTWLEHTISAGVPGVRWVTTGDVDGDGDRDVLSASFADDKIAWYENVLKSTNPGVVDGAGWTLHVITLDADGATSVFAADIDGDGDLDALSSSFNDDKVAWYENDGDEPPAWTPHTITTFADGAESVVAAYLDNDGDLDVLSASAGDHTIAWYENVGVAGPGEPIGWIRRIVTYSALGATSLVAVDFDFDGHTDVVVASTEDNTVSVYFNSGDPRPRWTGRAITLESAGARSVAVGDIDGDSAPDVVVGSFDDGVVAWFENGFQSSCGDGIQNAPEQCDDGNTRENDGCRNDCTIPECGDDIVDGQRHESCDPPGKPTGAAGNVCRADCTVCGDRQLDVGEECDDGDSDDGDNCRNDCTRPPTCGNAIVDPGETCDDGNTADGDCCAADCTFEPVESACDDDIFCTAVDACDGAGVCLGSGEPDCDDGDICTDDSCDSVTDACLNDFDDTNDPTCATCGDGVVGGNEQCDDGNTADGDCCAADCTFEPVESACDDDIFCTAVDACDGAGVCLGSGEPDCDDGDICTDDSCDSVTDACLNDFDVTNDPTCATCGDGVVGGNEQCDDGNTADGDCCAADCTFEPVESACDDGIFCTAVDACDGAGVCLGSGEPDCDDTNICTDDSCDSVTDACLNDFDVTNDPTCATCGDGVVGGNEQCDDGNTADGDCCAADCTFEPVESACDDGIFCTAVDACDGAGVCLGSGEPDCDDTNICTDDSCDSVTDACLNDFDVTNDPTCATCGDGVVGGNEQCDDGNTADGDCCAADCTFEPVESACDDGIFCTAVDACDGAGVCLGSGEPDCDDTNICTDDSCDSVTDACLNDFDVTNDPTCATCGDGVVGGMEQCDDGNTADGDCCAADCTFEPVESACDDGIFCTAVDACDGAGVCLGSGEPDCDDTNICTDDSCDSVTDACLNDFDVTNDPTCATCGDGVVGGNEQCDDGNTAGGDCCAADCTFEPVESACDDGIFCTAVDACDGAGVCLGSGEPDCDDTNICTDDSCDAATDACLNVEDTTNDPSCEPSECGNGIVEGLEACDDGNAVGGDGCDPNCRLSETLVPTAASGSLIVSAGTGLFDQPGSLSIEIPENSEVKQVLLYWNGFHLTTSGDDEILVDGIPVTGTLIGGPTLFFGSTSSSTYRADITALGVVDDGPGTQVIAIDGLDFDPGPSVGMANGASIVVILDDGTEGEIDLREGQDLAYVNFVPPLNTTVPQAFDFTPAPTARSATLTIVAGSVASLPDGSPRPNVVRITIDGVVTNLTDVLASASGDEWDNLVVPVEIPAGASSISVAVLSNAHGTGQRPASLAWIVAGLTVPAP